MKFAPHLALIAFLAVHPPCEAAISEVARKVCPNLLADLISYPVSDGGPSVEFHHNQRASKLPAPTNLMELEELQTPKVREMVEWLDLPESQFVYLTDSEWKHLGKLTQNTRTNTPQQKGSGSQLLSQIAYRIGTRIPGVKSGLRTIGQLSLNRAANQATRQRYYRVPLWYLNVKASAQFNNEPVDIRINALYSSYQWARANRIKPSSVLSTEDVSKLPIREDTKTALIYFLEEGGALTFKTMSHVYQSGIIANVSDSQLVQTAARVSLEGGIRPETKTIQLSPLPPSISWNYRMGGDNALASKLDLAFRHELAHFVHRASKVRFSLFAKWVRQKFPVPNDSFLGLGDFMDEASSSMEIQKYLATIEHVEAELFVHKMILTELPYRNNMEVAQELLDVIEALRPDLEIPEDYESRLIEQLSTLREGEKARDQQWAKNTENTYTELLQLYYQDLGFFERQFYKVQLHRTMQIEIITDEIAVRKLVGGLEEIDYDSVYSHFDQSLVEWAEELSRAYLYFLEDTETYRQYAALLRAPIHGNNF